MRIKQKLAILLVAAILTVFGFSLIAAPSVEIMRVGKNAGYQIISDYLANSAALHAGLKG